MGNAKLLKKYAFVDPTHILESHGWNLIPSSHTAFTMWENPKVSGVLFLYEGGEWHLVDRNRTVVNGGHNLDTMIAWLTGDVKPVEHIGSKEK
jgi:hypothetical protein